MSLSPRIFARITKIDEAQRLVYGRATQEIVDRAEEVMDYASSKPYFEKWSSECYKDSAGKSLGNVRAMHGAVSAGKLTDIQFDDEEMAVDVCSKVVDDNEWNKVLEGCYTGYSIGGGYVKKWADKVGGKKVTRFTANPSEISLVDRPCVPTAKFFDIMKSDGSVTQQLFKAFTEPGDSTPGIAGHGSGDPKKKPKKKPDEEDDVKTCKLAKGCEAVSSFADLIQRLKWVGDSAQWEKDFEGDNSDLPIKIRGKTSELLELLAEMAIEEAGELRTAQKVDMGSMAKFLGIDLAKAGRRNSSSDLALIQTAHDSIAKLGAACKAEPAEAGPITDLENPIMADDVNKGSETPDLKKAAGAPGMGGTSGSPGGKDIESTNAKADDADAETPEERAERLKSRKAKKMADAQKAAGLPANGEELQALLKKNADETEARVVGVFAKIFGVDPDAKPAEGAAADPALAKAAPADPAKRPALFAVDKDGSVAKANDPEALRKSVDPVPGDNGEDPMRKAATLIKAIHSRGPGWYENQGMLAKAR
jgi:hypothetical protein